MLWLFLLSLTSFHQAQACGEMDCKDLILGQIHQLEKAYFDEHKTFSDTLSAIGYYQPDRGAGDSCTEWSLSLSVPKTGDKFTAYVENRDTGESWITNEKNEIKMENPGPALR